jgi:hypothetical protein
MASVYRINKGINRPLEFRGLKAQYIGYLAMGLLALLLGFTLLYLLGVSLFFCLGLVLPGGTGLFLVVYRLSHRYGPHGLQKKWAQRRLPVRLRVHSRHLFLQLLQKN